MLQQSEYFDEGSVFHGLVPAVFSSKLDLMTVGLPKDAAEALWEKVWRRCDELEKMLNWTDSESEIGRFNAGKMLAHSPVSDELGEVVDACKEYRSRTGGLFDPALGKMQLVDHDEEDGSLSLYGVKLNLGSFSRGWLMRSCKALLDEAGAGCAFLNLGNFAFTAVGHHPYGESWKVGLSNPFTRMPLEEIALKDASLALSCNAPGSTGRVIRPSTMQGCEDRKMCVAIGPDPLEVKVVSSAMMIATAGEEADIREAFPDIEMSIYNL